jgi:hypothetical protein
MFKRQAFLAVEQRHVTLDGQPVNYTLKRSAKRRSIGLRIDSRGLTVSVPHKASEQWLNQVLQDRAGWVVQKLTTWQAAILPQAVQWMDGECIPYLGEKLTLRVGVCATTLRDKELWLPDDALERRVMQWYRQQAITLFGARVAHYAHIMNVQPHSLTLSTAKTRWGSCNSKGAVRLNLQLIKLPLSLVDYVVVHELAHLRQMNHSPAFWRVVGNACPDYLLLRCELKKYHL